MADLGAFLQRSAARARDPGKWDCCAMPAAWAISVCGRDPMAAWRGAYSTEAGGERLADDAGGLVELFARGFAAIGWPVVDELRPGVVGVIEIGDLQAGAIYVGPRWAFSANRGVGFASVEPEHVRRAWGPDG